MRSLPFSHVLVTSAAVHQYQCETRLGGRASARLADGCAEIAIYTLQPLRALEFDTWRYGPTIRLTRRLGDYDSGYLGLKSSNIASKQLFHGGDINGYCDLTQWGFVRNIRALLS
jgi:hypothetical protein